MGHGGVKVVQKCFIFVSIYGPLAGVFPPRKARLGTLFAPAAFCPQAKRAGIKLFALLCFRPQTKTSVRLKVDQSSKEGASKRFGATSGLSSRAAVWEKFSRTKSGGGVGIKFKERVGTRARVMGVSRKIHDNTYDLPGPRGARLGARAASQAPGQVPVRALGQAPGRAPGRAPAA